jgi:thiol-disulfide isomerase/thioredoxin
MTENGPMNEKPARRPQRLLIAGLAGIAAVALGFGVLYGTATGPGKDVAAACPAAAERLAARLAPLAHGEVAALNVEKQPHQAMPLAFKDADGARKSLADFHGRAVLLNLWATWCAPCRAEMPALDRLQAQLGGADFEVVAVNVDTARLDRPKAFLDEIGIKNLTRYADPSGDAFEALRVSGKALGLPTSLLIGKDGCELGIVAGPAKWDSDDAIQLIKTLNGV